MDILTHILSGTAVGTVAASVSRKDFHKKGLILALGALGGLLPDVDVVSRWSGFDNTFGRWFNLSKSGEGVYFANHWYSHHNFTHSILSALTAAAALIGLIYVIRKFIAKKKTDPLQFFKDKALYAGALFAGYIAHLAGDLPTPSSTWGGIKLFWPLDVSVGGWGYIWWWNNYDIFLLVYACCLVNVILLLACRPKGGCMKLMPVLVLVITLSAVVYQIDSRPVSFSSKETKKNYNQLDADSLKVQRDILGKELYGTVKSFDGKLEGLGIYF